MAFFFLRWILVAAVLNGKKKAEDRNADEAVKSRDDVEIAPGAHPAGL